MAIKPSTNRKLTLTEIYNMPAEELVKHIAESVMQWYDLETTEFVNLKSTKGIPFGWPENSAKQPVPSYGKDYTSLGQVIEVLVESCRLDLSISRANGVTEVALYDKFENLEYVSTSYEHFEVPRLVCEAALMYICDLPYEKPKVETNVCDVPVLPTGCNRESVPFDCSTTGCIS